MKSRASHLFKGFGQSVGTCGLDNEVTQSECGQVLVNGEVVRWPGRVAIFGYPITSTVWLRANSVQTIHHDFLQLLPRLGMFMQKYVRTLSLINLNHSLVNFQNIMLSYCAKIPVQLVSTEHYKSAA